MSVLIDTSIWSEAFRRRSVNQESPQVLELRELVRECNAVMIGAVRQELLSGITDTRQFEALRDRLRAFPDVPLHSSDYEFAALHFTTCRRHGIQGSNTDFLICAVADRIGVPIFTSDRDFSHFSAHVPVRLHRSRFSKDDLE